MRRENKNKQKNPQTRSPERHWGRDTVKQQERREVGAKLHPAVDSHGEGLINSSERCLLPLGETNENSSFITIWSRSRATQPRNPTQSLFCISGEYKEGKAVF